jgi:SAM-dependent methyltransferase
MAASAGRRQLGRRFGVRRRLADRYLAGSGIEIGPLHLPLSVPRGVRVRYLDRMDVPELRQQYPELADLKLVTPDVIDDGETLSTIDDHSVDFVIANHMIEHCEDPIGTLSNHLRVLRDGGVLYMAVPDARRTFDRDRPATPLAHIVRDHLEGPDGSRHDHYLEWARLVAGVRAQEVPLHAEELERSRYSIHFHVFTPHTFLELLLYCRRELGLPAQVECCVSTGHEFIVIIRRS